MAAARRDLELAVEVNAAAHATLCLSPARTLPVACILSSMSAAGHVQALVGALLALAVVASVSAAASVDLAAAVGLAFPSLFRCPLPSALEPSFLVSVPL